MKPNRLNDIFNAARQNVVLDLELKKALLDVAAKHGLPLNGQDIADFIELLPRTRPVQDNDNVASTMAIGEEGSFSGIDFDAIQAARQRMKKLQEARAAKNDKDKDKGPKK